MTDSLLSLYRKNNVHFLLLDHISNDNNNIIANRQKQKCFYEYFLLLDHISSDNNNIMKVPVGKTVKMVL